MSRVTLSRYLIEQTRSNNTPADLRFLIEVVARACKEISHAGHAASEVGITDALVRAANQIARRPLDLSPDEA